MEKPTRICEKNHYLYRDARRGHHPEILLFALVSIVRLDDDRILTVYYFHGDDGVRFIGESIYTED